MPFPGPAACAHPVSGDLINPTRSNVAGVDALGRRAAGVGRGDVAFRIIRTADVSWRGTVDDGGGRLAVGSGALDAPFTLKARVEEGQKSPNPEELIGAAHAGCFTMSLASVLSEEGHPPNDLSTTARVHLEQVDTGFSITRIELKTVGSVDGVDGEEFGRLAEQAKATCPVSRVLTGTEITLETSLAAD
jgi:osmotically inducible protein OsmC